MRALEGNIHAWICCTKTKHRLILLFFVRSIRRKKEEEGEDGHFQQTNFDKNKKGFWETPFWFISALLVSPTELLVSTLVGNLRIYFVFRHKQWTRVFFKFCEKLKLLFGVIAPRCYSSTPYIALKALGAMKFYFRAIKILQKIFSKDFSFPQAPFQIWIYEGSWVM